MEVLGSLILPKLSSSERDAISGWGSGALIFNTTLGVTQQYNGSAWSDLVSSNKDVSSGQNLIEASESVTIEAKKEMIVTHLTVDGILTVDGTLTIK